MTRRDKRSLILCLVLGDGSLFSDKRHSRITISHCDAQADLLSWKAALVGNITGRYPKMRIGGTSKYSQSRGLQFSLHWKRIRAWHKRFYPNRKKDRLKMLPFIHHPELAIAIWLCDDGSSDKDGRLRLHTNAMSQEDNTTLSEWIFKHLGVRPKVLSQWSSLRKRSYAYLQFNVTDTVVLYTKVRDFLLQFDSMKNKFQRTERRFQRVSTEPSASRYGKDIVHHN